MVLDRDQIYESPPLEGVRSLTGPTVIEHVNRTTAEFVRDHPDRSVVERRLRWTSVGEALVVEITHRARGDAADGR